MKKKFLTVLYEMKRRYNHPLARIFKNYYNISGGWCWAFDESCTKLGLHIRGEEYRAFRAIMNEEGEKLGASFDNVDAYWWPPGKLNPRRKLLNRVINRIENVPDI